jgi:hypothetical protein
MRVSIGIGGLEESCRLVPSRTAGACKIIVVVEVVPNPSRRRMTSTNNRHLVGEVPKYMGGTPIGKALSDGLSPRVAGAH